MRILVTGATGFVGKNLINSLSKNHRILALVRKKSKNKDILFLKERGVELFYENITSLESMSGITSNIDAVIHCAGKLGGFDISWDDLYKTNVVGTRNILKLCNKQKFIYLSSAGIHGAIFNGNEESIINPQTNYEKSKAIAERYVKSYRNHIILRPEFLYGPHDMHVLKLFGSIKMKRFFLLGKGDTYLHPTYIDDLVHVVLECLNSNIKNQTFIVAGEKAISVRDFYYMVAKQLNAGINKVRIPLFLARMYSSILEPIGKMAGFCPALTNSRIDFFTKNRKFDTKKIREFLNYRPIKIEQGIQNTIDWYHNNKFI